MTKKTKLLRDVSKDYITNETLEEVETIVQNTNNYGIEDKMIESCFTKYPNNIDKDLVVMKICTIDITNSTNLILQKRRISINELSNIIASIPNIDERIAVGDPEVVNEIARANGKINLFSFATKYCCYHNINIYGRDDYSIIDGVLTKYLPKYFDDITESQILKCRNSFDYESYNSYITRKLNELNITVDNRKRKFDHFVWYKNKQWS